MGVVGPGMTSITDSKVGLASWECSAPNNVVRMVEPAGRNHRYGYTIASFGNVVVLAPMPIRPAR